MQPSCHMLIAPDRIDSALKLHLVLLFLRHPQLCGTAAQLNAWLHVSPWEIAEALEALATAGLLARSAGPHGHQYRLAPAPEYQPLLKQLPICYDDPQQRDAIVTLAHAADQERQFRAWSAVKERALGEPGKVTEWEVVI